MKKLKQVFIYVSSIIALILLTNQYVYAARQEIDVNDYIKKVEYSEGFENWVSLSQDEKNVTFYPKIYDDLNTPFSPENPIYKATLVGASVNSKFSLSEKIPNNLAIRNQYDTTTCWAFAGLSSLETNLALNDYKNGITNKIYDFSERHANYSSTRGFLNGATNMFGINRLPGDGGQWYMIENYLTNGQGAIAEEDMPFENSSDIIDISEIQNKKVISQVYDTVYFDNYNNQTGEEKTETMNEIKQHIQNYGSVFATIHGGLANSILDSCYDNNTATKYCNNSILHKTDHAVSLIGWDDNFDRNKFPENARPSSNGAWIVRNSWGENLEYDLYEFKLEVYNTYTTQCNSRGWDSPEKIPDEFIVSAGYKIEGDKVLLPIGDHGLMYVSYEDCNVGTTLYGIKNSSDNVNYDYIYQYNELYPAVQINYEGNSTILCNVFDKQSDEREYLTEVSIMAPETYTCRVFVNPDGDEKTESKLKLVELKSGESEEISAGYHTLEFVSPIEITGEQYTVAVEITGTRETLGILVEGVIDGLDAFSNAKIEKERCYVATETDLSNCEWIDLGKLKEESPSLINSDSSIKAFTTIEVEDDSLNKIEIETPPTKTEYIEGENFDKSGMVVKAYFNNDTEKELSDSDYSIKDGTNLKVNQKYVTIEYMDKSVNQEIKVNPKVATKDPTKDSDDDKDSNEDKKPDNKNPEDNAPKNSNMSNAYCVVKNIQSYQYTNDASKNYTLVDVEISGISKADGNDSYEYSYYISSNSALKNITDWVKIKETQKDKNKLSFKVDFRDVSNFSEISKANSIYIYIKETVTKGGSQSVQISKSMNFDTGNANIDTYVDNVKKDNSGTQNKPSDNNAPSNNNNNNNNGGSGTTQNNQGGQTSTPKDGTVSSTNLPKAGKTMLIILIFVITIVGIVMFVRYEILNRSMK